jgi:hypothetical protein
MRIAGVGRQKERFDQYRLRIRMEGMKGTATMNNLLICQKRYEE